MVADGVVETTGGIKELLLTGVSFNKTLYRVNVRNGCRMNFVNMTRVLRNHRLIDLLELFIAYGKHILFSGLVLMQGNISLLLVAVMYLITVVFP
jgi:hypothetical protein